MSRAMQVPTGGPQKSEGRVGCSLIAAQMRGRCEALGRGGEHRGDITGFRCSGSLSLHPVLNPCRHQHLQA